MKISRLLLMRLLAGGIGFLPSLAAAIFLDVQQYGLGATSFALAMMVVGPVGQYASQGYMRALLLPERAQIPALHIVVVFMTLVSIVLMGMVATALTPLRNSIIFLVAVFSIVLAKLEEVRQISQERQIASVLLFYIIPPSIITGVFAIAWVTAWRPEWFEITIILSAGYLLPALLSMLLRGAQPLQGSWRIDRKHIWLLWQESRTFLVSGIINSAGENMPTLALTLLGAPQRVATFEVMRKLSSAISVFLHGLAIAYAPRIITAAAQGDMAMVVQVIRQNARLSILFALIYIPAAVVMVVILGVMGWKNLHIPAAMAVPLLLSALVTCLASPFGLAVTAFHKERWWVIGGLIAFTVFLLTLSLAPLLGAMETVAVAVLLQNTALSITITLVVRRLIRRRMPSSTAI